MGVRFRRSLRVAPGLRVNLTKTGFGLTAGRRGPLVSVNSHGRVGGFPAVHGTAVPPPFGCQPRA